MRSSSSKRSRNKSSSRSRGVGNVINRVFESAGPEGKVRGTPQQIIEKYLGLARDAQLSGDRVAAENFQQHAEHYARLLGDAQREQSERQSQDGKGRPQDDQPGHGGEAQAGGQEAHGVNGHANGHANGAERHADRNGRDGNNGHDAGGGDRGFDGDDDAEMPGDVLDADSGLVETPENSEKPKPKRSRTRRSASNSGPNDDDGSQPLQ